MARSHGASAAKCHMHLQMLFFWGFTQNATHISLRQVKRSFLQMYVISFNNANLFGDKERRRAAQSACFFILWQEPIRDTKLGDILNHEKKGTNGEKARARAAPQGRTRPHLDLHPCWSSRPGTSLGSKA